MSDSQDATPPLSADGSSSDGQTLQTQHGSVPSAPVDPGATRIPSAGETLPPVGIPGQTIAGYVIEGELGRGGMGVVYRARQPGLNRVVALKMILHADHAGADDRLRFFREAESLARLRHENIVQVYEVGEHDGKPFISLEYVEGGSLDQHLMGTPLPPLEAARLVRQLADGVQAAHEAGIIHRDLKPANVLLVGPAVPEVSRSRPAQPDLHPKITDFGLAKNQDAAGLSVSGAVMGTPSYMAPEQAAGKGKDIDARTDVYALGAILYECLTGRPPFRAATAMDTMMQVMKVEPVSVRSLQPSTPMDIETICLKCLQKESGKRYGTARELAEDLGRFSAGEPVHARPVGRLERGWRWCRRNPTMASLLVGIALLLMTVAAVSSVLGRLAWLKAAEARTAQEGEASKAEEERKARKEAEKQTGEKETARKEAVEEKENAKRLLYASRLALVQSFWAEGKVEEAGSTLAEVEEQRHTWEHRYLHTLINHRGQRTFLGHTGAVFSVSFSPDGKRIASGSIDGTVKVWDAATGRDLLTLKGQTDNVQSVSFSPDGKLIASGGGDETVKVWDAATGQDLLTLKGHTGQVFSVSFSPDSKRIASGSEDKTVRVWDVASGQNLLTIEADRAAVLSVCFSPDGKRIAAGIYFSRVKVWDAATGQDLLTVKGHKYMVFSVSFSPDGKRIASGGYDGTVIVWDAATGQDLLTLKGHTASVRSVSFSPDGKRIASGSEDQTVKVWDATSGQNQLTLRGHTSVVFSVSFSPDGRLIASGGGTFQKRTTVKVWDATRGQNLFTLKGHTWVYSVSFSPDGKRIASGGDEGTVKVCDAATGQDLFTLKGHTGAVFSVSFSSDGKHIVTGGGTPNQLGEVKLWDGTSGQELFSFKGHTSHVNSVSFSPDGKHIASGSGDQTVKVWDAVTGKNLLTLKGHTQRVISVTFSSDGKRIASGSGDQSVKVWDAHTGQDLFTLKGHTSDVNSVSFSPDGKRIASGGGDGIVKMWDVELGLDRLTLKGHTRFVRSVSFSPDGKRIASGSGDQTVKLWDANTGQDLLTLKGHTVGVWSVSFSPDGKRIASGGGDIGKLGEVSVWEATAGQDLFTLQGHTGEVFSVSFSPDGKRIASGGVDGTVKVWDPVTGQNLLTLKGHKSMVLSVSFSPDGKRIASGIGNLDQHSELKVWDATTGQNQMTLQGHTGGILSVNFSPDGKRIVSGSYDKTVKVWDAITGQNLLTLTGHTGAVASVSFSSDGKRVVSWGDKGACLTWTLGQARGQPIADAGEQVDFASPRSPDGRYFAVPEGMLIRVHRLPTGKETEQAGYRWWIDPNYGWHVDQTQESWQVGDWFAVAFHLDRLLHEQPWDAGLRVRRAHALSCLGRTRQATANYLHALLLDPRVGLWPLDPDAARRGGIAAQASDWPRAVADFEFAVHQPASTLETWSDLLLACQAATADFELALHQPGPTFVWFDLLRARRDAASKDVRRTCKETLDRFERDAGASFDLAFACRVTPSDQADALRLLTVAERLVAARRDAMSLDCLGAALYRAGRFEEAARTLQESIKVHGNGGYIDAWLFLAMSQQRLGRGEEARGNFGRFQEWMKDQKFEGWQNRERRRLLHEEARALILRMPPALRDQ